MIIVSLHPQWTWEWFLFFLFAACLTTQRFKQGHHCDLYILSLLTFQISPASQNLLRTIMSKIGKTLACISFKRPFNLLCSYTIYTHWRFLTVLHPWFTLSLWSARNYMSDSAFVLVEQCFVFSRVVSVMLGSHWIPAL